jgi:hypothetical protein
MHASQLQWLSAEGSKVPSTSEAAMSANVKPTKKPQRLLHKRMTVLQLRLLRRREVTAHQKKIGRKMFLIHACNMMIRAEWKRQKGVQW